MFITDSFNNQIDDILVRICEKLQLTPTQYRLAEERYKSVGNWLHEKDSNLSQFSPDIYPQGSLRIGTTVKPLIHQEFDLDLVCELHLDWQQYNPINILNMVEQRLRLNSKYAPLVERKNRCIRLNYANEFHMDILPGAPNLQKGNGCLKVPDREAKEWKDSNPKGYAKWFEDQTIEYYEILAKRLEPLPRPEKALDKAPLKRAVQLFKRFRDISFQKNPKIAPISIVLTTLVAESYRSQFSVNDTISAALNDIIQRIPPVGHRLVVLNPTNCDEDLSERWEDDPELYKKFVEWINDFSRLWLELNVTKGIQNVSKLLEKMFGETVTMEAFREQAEIIEKARKENVLSVSLPTGLITSNFGTKIIPIERNTFHGE